MGDTKQEVIQELKDIFKYLGFQENKKMFLYVKKIDNSLTFRISFFNKNHERIILESIDILFDSYFEIKSVYFLENGYKIINSKKITITEFYYLTTYNRNGDQTNILAFDLTPLNNNPIIINTNSTVTSYIFGLQLKE